MAFSGSTFSLLKDWLRAPWRNNLLLQAQLDAEFSGIATGLTSVAATAFDPTIVALAALDTSAGLVTQTGTDTFTKRSLAAPAAGFTITNPAGTAGNPTFVLANDIAAVEGLAATGIARRTGTDAWSAGTTVATAEIADDAVTYAKIQNVSATSRVLGRITAGAGDVEELTGTNVKTVLSFPTVTTDNTLPRFDGVAGNLQTSGIVIDDSNNTSVPGVITAASGTATPAAGSTAARLLLGTTAGFGIYYGSSAPTVSAGKGSLYLRSDGTGTSDRMYVNTDGATTWTAVTTAA